MKYPTAAGVVWAGLTLLAVASLSGQAPESSEKSIAALSWLSGCWLGDGGEECWLAPLGGTMAGINRGPEREGKAPAFEFLRIVEEDGELVFLASPSGRFPPTPFRASEVSASRVVFANPEHDFPQRITYWLEDGEVLRARVEAQQNGEWGGFEMRWQRSDWEGAEDSASVAAESVKP